MFCFGDDCVALITLHLMRLFPLESKWDPLGLKARMNEWDFLVLYMCILVCVIWSIFVLWFSSMHAGLFQAFFEGRFRERG